MGWFSMFARDVPAGKEFFARKGILASRCMMIAPSKHLKRDWYKKAVSGEVKFYVQLESAEISWTFGHTLVWLAE